MKKQNTQEVPEDMIKLADIILGRIDTHLFKMGQDIRPLVYKMIEKAYLSKHLPTKSKRKTKV